jgi:hypothetical protein
VVPPPVVTPLPLALPHAAISMLNKTRQMSILHVRGVPIRFIRKPSFHGQACFASAQINDEEMNADHSYRE